MREIKVGDRYEFDDSDSHWFIYEYISVNYDVVIIDSNSKYPISSWTIGEINNWQPDDDKYMGNFAKSDNFSNLYNILSELS